MEGPHEDLPRNLRGRSGLFGYAGAMVLWYLLASLGLRYLLPPAHVTLIWLASGVTVGLLFITPQNRRGVLLAAVAVLHAATNATSGHTLFGAVAFALAYAVDAAMIVAVYERLMAGLDRSFTTVRSVLVFALVAIGIPAVTGSLGAFVCTMAYGSIDIGEAWFIWSVTDALGVMIFAPLVVVWSDVRPARIFASGWRHQAIALLWFMLLAVLLEFLVGTHLPVQLPVFARAYLAFPLLFLWTYKYGVKGATVALLPMAGVMLWNSLDGSWSQIWPSASFPRVVTVQLFLVVLSVSGLAFAALLRERAATLERLRTSADHQRDLARRLEVQVERIPLGLVVLDRSGIIREWNPAAETIFGMASRDAIGQSLADRLIPADRRHVFTRLQDEAAKGDRSVRTTAPAVKNDGTPLQIEWNATPLRGEEGLLSGVLATAQDVTDRARSEKKIQRLNRLNAFLSQINQAIVRSRSRDELFRSVCAVAVQHGKFRFAWIGEIKPDAHAIEPLAYAGEGEPYLAAMRQVPPGGTHGQRTPMATAIMNQKVEVVQRLTTDTRMAPWYDQIRACGFASSVSLPVHVSGMFNGCLDVYAAETDYFDPEEMDVLHEIRGDLLFALGNLALDGRHRSTEQALQVSESRFRTIVESIDDLVFTLDREQRHTGAYGRALGRAGLNVDFFLGRTAREVLGQEAGAIHEPYNARALAGEVVQYEWESGAGENRQVFSTSLSPRLDENGAIVGVTGVARDVTQRKKMEEELREERALLARRVEERTAELTLANEALAHASRLKDEFLASMSHELRTPLTGILGMSEALQMQVYGSLNDRQARAVRTIGESGQHLLELINDILDLSRIEAGKLALQNDVVDVPAIVQSAAEMVRRAAEGKRLILSIVHDERVRTTHADPRRLKQVLANILSNAVKFTPEGGSVALEVKGDPDNARLIFTCTDTGIGMSPADLPRLFQPFVQLDSRLSREYTGSGLGLSLVHRIVELHGGSVHVESEPGRGVPSRSSFHGERTQQLGRNRMITLRPCPGYTVPAYRSVPSC